LTPGDKVAKLQKKILTKYLISKTPVSNILLT